MRLQYQLALSASVAEGQLDISEAVVEATISSVRLLADSYFDQEEEEDDDDDDSEALEPLEPVPRAKKPVIKAKPSNGGKGKSDSRGNTLPQDVVPDKDYRGRYYFEKFQRLPKASEVSIIEDEFMTDLITHYVEGLVWCLAYYIKGCVSWTWYYPFHYGPMLQDLRDLPEIAKRVSFKLGNPFTPFQQLLGCLPPASKLLLPVPYQWLMTSSNSPCLHFYPAEFAVDMTHKKNPWEATVLLPFIDERLLLEAEEKYCAGAALTKEERLRNSFGTMSVCYFNPNITETYFACGNPSDGFGDIAFCQTSVREIEPSLAPGSFFEPRLVPGTEPYLPGYPSLTTIPLEDIEVDEFKVNVFGTESKYRTMVIKLAAKDEVSLKLASDLVHADETVKQLALAKVKVLLGKSVFVNYPQLHEAKIVGASSEFMTFSCVYNHKTRAAEDIQVVLHDAVTAQRWRKDSESERTNYFKGRGIPGTGGLFIGDIHIRLKLVALQGTHLDMQTGARSKVFGSTPVEVPLQLVLWKHMADPRFTETESLPLSVLYPHHCEVVGIRGPYLGLKGKVVHEASEDASEEVVVNGDRPSLQEEHKKAGKKQPAKAGGARALTVEFQVPDTAEPQVSSTLPHFYLLNLTNLLILYTVRARYCERGARRVLLLERHVQVLRDHARHTGQDCWLGVRGAGPLRPRSQPEAQRPVSTTRLRAQGGVAGPSGAGKECLGRAR